MPPSWRYSTATAARCSTSVAGTRAVPTALHRALLDRDRSQCQFCDSRHCDAHHVVHWADGGETKLANLASLCRFHHRALHEEGFSGGS